METKTTTLNETANSGNMMLAEGCTLTIKNEIISPWGAIVFKPGDKVIVDEVLVNPGFYGKLTGQWHEEKIWGVKLKGRVGHWLLKAFEETSTACR